MYQIVYEAYLDAELDTRLYGVDATEKIAMEGLLGNILNTLGKIVQTVMKRISELLGKIFGKKKSSSTQNPTFKKSNSDSIKTQKRDTGNNPIAISNQQLMQKAADIKDDLSKNKNILEISLDESINKKREESIKNTETLKKNIQESANKVISNFITNTQSAVKCSNFLQYFGDQVLNILHKRSVWTHDNIQLLIEKIKDQDVLIKDLLERTEKSVSEIKKIKAEDEIIIYDIIDTYENKIREIKEAALESKDELDKMVVKLQSAMDNKENYEYTDEENSFMQKVNSMINAYGSKTSKLLLMIASAQIF